MSNKLSQLVAKVNGAKVPPYVKQCLLSGAFNFKVKFAATSGIRIAALSTTESTVHLKNRIRVQNHIGGIHACGMAILAESATGAVFGMNVPDTHIPVIKSMKIDFKRRAVGDLKAVARLTDEQVRYTSLCSSITISPVLQIREIQTTDK